MVQKDIELRPLVQGVFNSVTQLCLGRNTADQRLQNLFEVLHQRRGELFSPFQAFVLVQTVFGSIRLHLVQFSDQRDDLIGIAGLVRLSSAFNDVYEFTSCMGETAGMSAFRFLAIQEGITILTIGLSDTATDPGQSRPDVHGSCF